MSNLLDRSSLVLTPTAYNNGEALCIKPDDASGDFQFSRNSAATRVNAQGLVENVQILSSNLVQNGDFSEEGVQEVSNGSFSQEGVEEITNGDFSSDTNWAKASGTTISDGKLNITANSTNDRTFQNAGMVQGKIYKLVLDVSNYQSGSLFILFGGSGTPNIPNITSNGTYTFYQECIGTNGYFYFGGNLFNGSIDNVSVREVGQDWLFAGGSEITEQGARINNTITGVNAYIRQSNSNFTIGKSFVLEYDVVATNGTTLAIEQTSSIALNTSTVGSNRKIYFQWDIASTGLVIKRLTAGTDVTITNISVKEVGQNWVLGTGWSIGDDKAVANTTGDFVNLYQNSVFVVGKTYKTTFTIVDYTQGSVRLTQGGIDVSGFQNAVGTYTAYFTATQTSLYMQGYQSFIGSITNITIIEITTDTSLPRINYEGFSYQDALGSELIVNGDFATDTAWGKVNATISGGTGNLNGTGVTSMLYQDVLTNGSTYKATFTISNYNSIGNSDIINAGGAPIYVINSNGTFTITFTHTNASGNIYWRARNSAIFSIDNVSVKEYLGQEVVPDSGCGSWLFEPQSSNLLTYSSDYNNSIWSKTGSASVTSNTTISPDGTQNADTLNIFSGNFFFQPVVGVGTFTLSCYVKVPNGTLDFKMQSFNGTDGANSSGIFVATTEWQRFEHTVTITANSSFYPIQVSGLVGGDFEIWGAQVEALTYATSYIPTSGSTVTRNQDLCTNGGSLASINSTEGVLYAEINTLNQTGTFRQINLSNGTTSSRVYISKRADNANLEFRMDNPLGGLNFSFAVDTTSDFVKVAFRYGVNNFAVFINGVNKNVSPIGSTFALGTLNDLQFSSPINQPFFGKTKALAVWKEALSDAELTELTTI